MSNVCDTIEIDVKSAEGYSVEDGPRGKNCGQYDAGTNAHPAVFDPARYQRIGFEMSVDNAGLCTFATQQRKAFFEGIGDAGTEAGTDSLVATQTSLYTNLDKGGYLAPPGAEAAITAIGFRPVGIFNKPQAVGTVPHPAPDMIAGSEHAIFRTLFEQVRATPDYWELSGKVSSRVLGPISRWNSFGGLATSGPDARYPGGVARLRPLQFKLFTSGPSERKDADRSDRLQLLLDLEACTIAANVLGTTPNVLAAGKYIVCIMVEAAVDLVTEMGSRVDAVQDSEITSLRARNNQLEERLAALEARLLQR